MTLKLEPYRNSAAQIAKAVRDGKLKVRDVADFYIQRTEKYSKKLNTHLFFDARKIRDDADTLQKTIDSGRGGSMKLAGVPVLVKDVICTKDIPTTCGSKMLENYRPPYDATAVELLQRHGALFFGKANMDEFAMGSSNENSAYGAVKNPWDLSRVPGGSSGGSAAAVAADLVPLALGSDTGGSIRQPASFCGITGFKPTYGAVSRYGLVAFGSSLDHIGPFSRSVQDSALLFDVLSGHDKKDSTSIELPPRNTCAALENIKENKSTDAFKSMKFGVVEELMGDGMDVDVRGAIETAIKLIESKGGKIVKVKIPRIKYAIATYYVVATAEASANLARYDGVVYGYRSKHPTEALSEMYKRTRSEGFGGEVKRRILLGTYVLSSGYYDAYYGKALNARAILAKDFADAFSQADILLSPTAPLTAFKIGEKVDDPLAMYLTDICTISSNLVGIPSISVPGGFAKNGMPIGLQLMAPKNAEEKLLLGAHLYEQAAGWISSKKTPASNSVLARYEPVMGLEVHCQLKTLSKLFCGCTTKFGALPNHNTCPVCLGLPGVLPVLNTEAVNFAVRMALAIEAQVREVSEFSRKQYFYPDLPKGYQITQYDKPYCSHGRIVLSSGHTVRILRIHLEEDAGKNVHGEGSSYVDLNRAGIPLMEIVSEPDIHTAEDAADYLKRLRSLVRHLGICDGNLEEGSFRCDVNVSIKPVGRKELGTRCEIKNLNSFRNIERAIKYEILRQADILDSGGKIIQQTLSFDAASGKTMPMRSKEESHDYRYFPEPDLLPLKISKSRVEQAKRALPELPEAMARRFQDAYQLPKYDADILTADKELAAYFEATLKRVANAVPPKIAANWVISEFVREANAREWDLSAPPISANQLGELLELVGNNTISGKIAKTVFEEMIKNGGNPGDIVKAKGLVQIVDRGAIEKTVDEVLARSQDQIQEYFKGKDKVFGFFVGEVMKVSRGKANPNIVNEIMKEKLSKLKPS